MKQVSQIYDGIDFTAPFVMGEISAGGLYGHGRYYYKLTSGVYRVEIETCRCLANYCGIDDVEPNPGFIPAARTSLTTVYQANKISGHFQTLIGVRALLHCFFFRIPDSGASRENSPFNRFTPLDGNSPTLMQSIWQ